ncbi:hypothetical protein, partial [Pseudomonas fluorescens]
AQQNEYGEVAREGRRYGGCDGRAGHGSSRKMAIQVGAGFLLCCRTTALFVPYREGAGKSAL